jgi:hypothetical protein
MVAGTRLPMTVGHRQSAKGTALRGCDLYTEALPVARSRNPAAELFQMDARRMPFEAAFAVVRAFDVLERIDADPCGAGGDVFGTACRYPRVGRSSWLRPGSDHGPRSPVAGDATIT